MKRCLLLLFGGMMLLSGCQSRTVAVEASSVPVPEGQAIFLSNCAACHPGPGNPPGPNPVVLQSGQLQSEEGFKRFLRKPLSPMMPAFNEEVLSEADIHELYVYLHTQKTPQPAE